MISFLKFVLVFGLLFLSIPATFSQGIKGKITDDQGNALAFASVYIRNLGDGVPSNEEGDFEIKLEKGIYDVLIQYLGYKSVIETVVVSDEWVTFNVQLEPQIYTLSQVEVKA